MLFSASLLSFNAIAIYRALAVHYAACRRRSKRVDPGGSVIKGVRGPILILWQDMCRIIPVLFEERAANSWMQFINAVCMHDESAKPTSQNVDVHCVDASVPARL